MKPSFMNKEKSRKARSIELMVAGGGLIIVTKLLTLLAPITLIGYGAYRFLAKKSRKDGLGFIAGGVAVGAVLSLNILAPLIALPYIFGAGMIGYGGFLMVTPDKTKKLEE